MRKFICFALSGALALSLLAGCTKTEDSASSAAASVPTFGNTSGAEDVNTPPTETEAAQASNLETGELADETETYAIETPYAILAYPVRWRDQVQTTVEGTDVYSLKFTAGETPLFDLNFGGTEGALLGTLKITSGNVVLRIVSYDIDENAENYMDLCIMQEDINVIIQHLAAEYDFTIGAEIIEEDTSTFEIETSLATLYYPQKWQDSVSVEVTDNKAAFSTTDGVQLFDLEFGQSEGVLLGTYGETELHIISYDIEQGERSEEDYNKLCAMQEDVNVILQHLLEDEAFTVHTN